jgi:hypothetical protein
MRFTSHGRTLAAAETVPTITGTGATAHMRAIEYDAGIRVLLTGRDAGGRRFRREARSVFGAYATAGALWGINRAWHVRDDGTRRLIFAR